MRTLLRALAPVAVVLAFASTAGAARPTIFQVDVAFPDSTCPGIDLTFRLQGTVVDITQSPKREILAAPNFTVSWSANGKTLTSRGPAPLMITYNPDGSIAQTKVPGLLVALTLPGSGLIRLETGLIVFDGPFFEGPVSLVRGPHDGFLSEADHELFCSYFQA